MTDFLKKKLAALFLLIQQKDCNQISQQQQNIISQFEKNTYFYKNFPHT